MKLPDGWSEEYLFNVVNVINNSVKPYEGQRSYLSTGDLNDNKIKNVINVNFDDKPSRANQNVEVGDVIFAKMKETKKTLIITKDIKDIIVSTGFFVLRPKHIINSKYLYFYLNSSKFLNRKDTLCTGATQSALNLQGFNKIKIVLPPLENQKNIVKVLEKAENALEKRKEANKLLDEYLKSVFVEMFEAESTSVKIVNDVVKSIDAGWSTGGEEREIGADEIAVLKISAVTKGIFDASQYKVIAKDIEIKKHLSCKKGDILFSRANTRELVGASCIVDKDYDNLILPDKLWRITVDEDIITREFFLYLINTDNIRKEISKLATGTSGSMLNISMAKFKSIELSIPSIDKQKKFSDIYLKIKNIQDKAQINEIEIANLFNSLMKDAFKYCI